MKFIRIITTNETPVCLNATFITSICEENVTMIYMNDESAFPTNATIKEILKQIES